MQALYDQQMLLLGLLGGSALGVWLAPLCCWARSAPAAAAMPL